jgi:phosphopantothenoylcysteine decarboxylase/phosphopantothenate--cysteine ligase
LYTDVDSVKHIALAQETDLIIVAPATAAFIARYAAGIADDLLLNVLLATKAKVVIAPAMHTEMWHHPATVENVNKLRARGVFVLEPEIGRLTGSDSGTGRLPEPATIVQYALSISSSKQDLVGYHFTIATGGTREPIDTVRFIGNRSSGKQGVALAEEVQDRGAKVTIIAANVDLDLSAFADVQRVTTTAELNQALQGSLKSTDVIMMPAAVSDYRLNEVIAGKLHRDDSSNLELQLIANPDVIAGLARARETTKPLIVGFAAEVRTTDNTSLEDLAKSKLTKKNIDMVVANDVSDGQVFDSNANSVVVVSKAKTEKFSGSKREVARGIINEVLQLLKTQ